VSLLLCYHYTEQYTQFVGTFVIYGDKGIEQITISNTEPIPYNVGMTYMSTPVLIKGEQNDEKLMQFRADKEAVKLYNKRYKYKSVAANIGAWLN